jgi:hypothetical protein
VAEAVVKGSSSANTVLTASCAVEQGTAHLQEKIEDFLCKVAV